MPPALGSRDDYDLFESAIEHWRRARKPCAKTLHEARGAYGRLREFRGKRRFSTLETYAIVGFRQHLQTRYGLKSASVKKMLALLRAVAAPLVSDNLLASNPFQEIRGPKGRDRKRVAAFSVEELTRISPRPLTPAGCVPRGAPKRRRSEYR